MPLISLPLTPRAWRTSIFRRAVASNLSMAHGLRGYSSRCMHLVLPTDEEKQANNLPADCPSQGSKGPATSHGSPAGELMHQLMN